MQNNDEYIQARLNICISSDNSRAASAIIAADPGNTQPLDFDGYKQYQEYGYAYDLAFKYFVYVLDHIDENGDIVWEMEIFDSNGIVYK